MKKSFVWVVMCMVVATGLCACGSNSSSDSTPTTTYSISGTVASSGAGLQGVTMTLNSSTTATTDASGNYTITGLANGSYSITPSKSGYTFDPTNSTQTVNSANITGVNFAAAPVDVTGTWSGTLTLNMQNGSGPFALTYVLTQSGSTVTGTIVGGNSGDPAHPISSATLAGNSLTIISYPAQLPYDDCHLYSNTFTYTVSRTTMSLTSASGTMCSGNGTGGHSSLSTITGGSGTLNKS